MTREVDWQLFEKAVDLTAIALRGSMGAENSKSPGYAAELFESVWEALKKAAQDLPENRPPGIRPSA
jgi:hypothetical protein